MAAETAEREFLVNQVVYDNGTRFGAEYELIPGKRSLYPYIATKLTYIIGKLGYGAKGVSEGMLRMIGSFLGM